MNATEASALTESFYKNVFNAKLKVFCDLVDKDIKNACNQGKRSVIFSLGYYYIDFYKTKVENCPGFESDEYKLIEKNIRSYLEQNGFTFTFEIVPGSCSIGCYTAQQRNFVIYWE